jgi:NTE family protein
MTMPTALVLSGGGAKGAFQVGATRYLYDHGFVPDSLCGSSVGALNVLKLAEGEGPDPGRGLSGLEELWGSLSTAQDMYAEEPWLARIQEDLRSMLVGLGGEISGPPDQASLGFLYYGFAGAWLFGDGRELLESARVIMEEAVSLWNLGPTEQKLTDSLDLERVASWATSGHRLRVAVVGLNSGRLRYVTENGELLERDGQPVVLPGATPEQCSHHARAVEDLERRLSHAREELATSAPGAKPALLQRIEEVRTELSVARRQLEACVRVNDAPVEAPSVDLRDAVLASAAIPGAFRPVGLAGDMCVDGGVMEATPLRAALDLGATDIVQVLVNDREPAWSEHPYHRKGAMATIASRSVELLTAAVAQDDVQVELPEGSRVRTIAPDVLLYGTQIVDPGLIQINRDYGYMRADDVMGRRSDRCRETSTLIAELRRDIWERENIREGHPHPGYLPPSTVGANAGQVQGVLEERLGHLSPGTDQYRVYAVLLHQAWKAGKLPEPRPGVQAAITNLKQRLGELIAERRRLGGSVPDDIDRWVDDDELHSWKSRRPPQPDATFVSQSVPGRTGLRGAEVKVVMRNTGGSTWTAGVVELTSLTDDWTPDRIALSRDVAPGAEAAFTRTVKPTSRPSAVSRWRLKGKHGSFFGEPTPAKTVQVARPECAALEAEMRTTERTIQTMKQLVQESTGTVKAGAMAKLKSAQARQQQIRAEQAELGC